MSIDLAIACVALWDTRRFRTDEIAAIRARMPLQPIHQFSSGAMPEAEAAVSAITTGRGHGASQDTAVPAR